MADLNATQLRKLARHLDALEKADPDHALVSGVLETPYARFAFDAVTIRRQYRGKITVQIIGPGEAVSRG